MVTPPSQDELPLGGTTEFLTGLPFLNELQNFFLIKLQLKVGEVIFRLPTPPQVSLKASRYVVTGYKI